MGKSCSFDTHDILRYLITVSEANLSHGYNKVRLVTSGRQTNNNACRGVCTKNRSIGNHRQSHIHLLHI